MVCLCSAAPCLNAVPALYCRRLLNVFIIPLYQNQFQVYCINLNKFSRSQQLPKIPIIHFASIWAFSAYCLCYLCATHCLGIRTDDFQGLKLGIMLFMARLTPKKKIVCICIWCVTNTVKCTRVHDLPHRVICRCRFAAEHRIAFARANQKK